MNSIFAAGPPSGAPSYSFAQNPPTTHANIQQHSFYPCVFLLCTHLYRY